MYLRYSTRFQDSVADQLREILKFARDQKIFVSRTLVFFDLAVRGFTNLRIGLDRMRAALRAKAANVLLLFSTSRLFRKQYRTLAFVDEVHRGLGVRCAFVKSGVDTNDKQRWESMLAIQSMVDQFVVTMNVANIQAAHQGLMEKRIVFGTLSYGYAGQPLPDQFTKRKRPRCLIGIDPVTAEIVVRIFRWYVEDKLTLAEIIRRLNDDESISLPPRATSGQWTRLAVKRVLQNTRYRGLWKYGVCESTYLPQQDYTRQLLRAEPLKEMQIEELRIVADDTWFAAQLRSAEESGNGGRKSKDGDHKTRPDALRGIFWCPEHERRLYVGGPYGRMMICPSCQRMPAATRPLFTQLNRQFALESLCRKLAEMVNFDEPLVQEILAACQLEVEMSQRPDPARLAELQSHADQIRRQIAFIRRTVDGTPEDESAAEQQIKDLQGQLKRSMAELHQLQAAMAVQPVMPSLDEIRALLQQLRHVLITATSGEAVDEDRADVREIIRMLTGGRIDLYQCGERQAYHGWLEGRFTVRLLPAVVEHLTGSPASCVNDAVDVVLEFKRPVSFDREAEIARQMHRAGKLCREIAIELGYSKSKVTKLLKYAAEKHGEVLEDGRSRRSKLAKKHLDPQLYDQIVEEVMRRYEAQQLLQDIALGVGVCRDSITAIIRKWHEERGLPVPDGRTRRKTLPRSARPNDLPTEPDAHC